MDCSAAFRQQRYPYTEKREVMRGGNWAHLPGDLLVDIAKRLKCVEHMSAFSAVCSSWRAASRTVKPNWAPATPCLVFPVITENDPSCEWNVFDLSTNKHCKFELPETLLSHYQGCGEGWIFTVSSDLDVQLINPLTQVQISLPSAQGLRLLVAESSHYHNRIMKELARIECIRRATVAKIPPNDELLVLVVHDLGCVAFAKPGDDVWSFDVHHDSQPSVEDVIVFNGQILILFGDGKLMGSSLDLFLTDRENLVFQEYVAGDIRGDKSLYVEDSLENLHLVESFGDVLMVLRHTRSFIRDNQEEERDFATLRFDVFKLDPEAKEWVKVNDLGDVSMFVGNHSAMAVSASNAINCKPNNIYFTDDKLLPTRPKWRGVGVFDLQSGEIEELCPKDRETYILSSCQSPSWFMPKFV